MNDEMVCHRKCIDSADRIGEIQEICAVRDDAASVLWLDGMGLSGI